MRKDLIKMAMDNLNRDTSSVSKNFKKEWEEYLEERYDLKGVIWCNYGLLVSNGLPGFIIVEHSFYGDIKEEKISIAIEL